jgi:hypothetical protein
MRSSSSPHRTSTTGTSVNTSDSTSTDTSHSGSLSSGSSPTLPGAYLTKTTLSNSGSSTTYNVTIPDNVFPGQFFSFPVPDCQRVERVRCPRQTRPGEAFPLTLPPEPKTTTLTVQLPSMAVLTAVVEEDIDSGNGVVTGAVAMEPEIKRVNQLVTDARDEGAAQACGVRIPPNISSGMQFTFTDRSNGQCFQMTCPDTAGPNEWIIVVPPLARSGLHRLVSQPPTMLDFYVPIPPDARPGELFYGMIHGRKVSVPCPLEVVEGQSVLCQVPFRKIAGYIQLAYESQGGGWYRKIRLSDSGIHLQWARIDQTATGTTCAEAGSTGDIGNVIDNTFDFNTSAFVHQITYLIGNDDRMRTGKLEWVAANEAVVDLRLTVDKNKTLQSYADIVAVQGQPLDKKTAWFQNICSQLTPAWGDGYIHMVVRRDHLFLDSEKAIMSLGMDDMRKPWEMEFLDEEAVDRGGVTREWFELVTGQLFDPNFGLWLSLPNNNQLHCNINPASGTYTT